MTNGANIERPNW